MSVRIRLRRVGRKAQPYYRVVVADSATPRDGSYLDTVGFYNPRTRPAELRMDLVRVDDWIARGAGMTTTVASLVRKARRGGDDAVALVSPDTQAGGTAAPVAEAPAEPEPTSDTAEAVAASGEPAPAETDEAASGDADSPATE